MPLVYFDFLDISIFNRQSNVEAKDLINSVYILLRRNTLIGIVRYSLILDLPILRARERDHGKEST